MASKEKKESKRGFGIKCQIEQGANSNVETGQLSNNVTTSNGTKVKQNSERENSDQKEGENKINQSKDYNDPTGFSVEQEAKSSQETKQAENNVGESRNTTVVQN